MWDQDRFSRNFKNSFFSCIGLFVFLYLAWYAAEFHRNLSKNIKPQLEFFVNAPIIFMKTSF